MFRHHIRLDKLQLSRLAQLKEELVELQGDSEDDEKRLQPFVEDLSSILVQATEDGWDGVRRS